MFKLLKKLRPADKVRLRCLAGLLLFESGFIVLVNFGVFRKSLYHTSSCLNLLGYILAVIGVILVITGMIFTKKYKFKINKKIVAQLLASTIQARYLTVIFLMVFVVHVACMGNAAYSIFSGTSALWINLGVIVISIFACALLAYTFPYVEIKPTNGHKVFFSAMSILPTVTKEIEIEKQLNIIPLVKMFDVNDEIKLLEGDILHILLTDKSGIEAFISSNFNYLKTGQNKSTELNLLKRQLELIRAEINSDLSNSKTNSLSAIIKAFGKYVFPSLSDVIDRLHIEFTQPVDYNNAKECFDVAKFFIDKYNKNRYKIIVNCTSGTAAPTCALSILSMKSNRQLLYCRQDNGVVTPIMTNKFDFKDLMDEISEELSNQY